MDTGPVGRDAIERARARQAFKLPLVELARIDPPGEIVKARERPAPLPRRHKIAHGLFANALQRAQPIADGKPLRVLPHGEIRSAPVHAGRTAPNVLPPPNFPKNKTE